MSVFLKECLQLTKGHAPGKYVQISYGLFLDFTIWRNMRRIGWEYPLFHWIIFWFRCLG